MSHKRHFLWLLFVQVLLYGYANCQELFFRIGSRTLNDGDSVNITDIGGQPSDREDPGNTLICNTTNVNLECCRNLESGVGAIGNWYSPTGPPVINLENFGQATDTLYRVLYAQHVRLASTGAPVGPLGRYTCSVPNSNGTFVNATINIINTLSVSSISISPINPDVAAGESFTLTCTATITGRSDTPSFTWTGQVSRGPLQGQAVQGSANTFTDMLRIARVSQHNPSVQCMASINTSTLMTSVTLSVSVPPTSAIITESTVPTVSLNYVLTCNVNIPSTLMIVSYSWMEGNTLLTGQNTHQLDLSPLQLTQNTTQYTCHYTATSPYLLNPVIGMSPSHEVLIIGVTVNSVTLTPPNPSGVAGVDEVTLICTGTLSGPAIAIVLWTGQMMYSLITTVPSSRVMVTLVITPVRQSYAGNYTCNVIVGASSMSTSVSLAVTAPTIPISIMESQSPVALRDYILTCVATPPSFLEVTSPSYQWRRNGQVVPNKNNNKLNLSSLPLSEDGAQYTCQYTASSVYVNNVDVTSSTHTITLTLGLLSSPPTHIQGIVQQTSVMLTWTQPDIDAVQNYIISYTRTAGCSDAPSGSQTISGSMRMYILSGLQENITYDITITARNFRNRLSSTESFTTLTEIPSGTVQGILLDDMNFTSITISWQPVDCLQQNSPITDYKIRYNETSISTGPITTTDTSFVAASLFPGTSYTFEIAAVNREGDGPYQQFIASTQLWTDISPIQSDNRNINISAVVISALVCVVLITGITSATIIVVYKMRGRRRTTATKAATDLTDSEYEVIDNSENKISITKHKLNLKQDINMSQCAAYGEIKTAEPSHESQNSIESNIYEKVQ